MSKIINHPDLRDETDELLQAENILLILETITKNVFKVLAGIKGISLGFEGFHKPQHYCKKSNYIKSDYSITKIGDQTFVHIPNTVFATGAERSIKLAYDVKSGKLVVLSKQKKKVKHAEAHLPSLNPSLSKDRVVATRCEKSPYIAKSLAFVNYATFNLVPDPARLFSKRTHFNDIINSYNVDLKFMDLYLNGSADIIFDMKCPLEREVMLNWVWTAALGVQVFHHNLMTHNDLKPGNFLIANDFNTLILNDFGFMENWKGVSAIKKSNNGTPCTIAPERQSRDPNLEYLTFEEHMSGDIYSLGACFYIFNHKGYLPWQDTEGRIRNLSNLQQFNINSFFHPKDINSLDYLCWEMMQIDYYKRPKIDVVLERLKRIIETDRVQQLKKLIHSELKSFNFPMSQ